MNILFRRTKKFFIYIYELCILVILYPIAHKMGKKKKIYIISERGMDARDNGSYMFRYYRQKYPEKKVYYVITKNSEDIKRVKKYGNIIYYKSLKHYIIFYMARYCISTHIFGYTPNIDFYSKLIRKGFLSDKFFISLKHGIVKNDIPNLHAPRTRLNLLISGARPEYEFMCKTFEYPSDVIKYTGFARFDGLHNYETKNRILVMPTWRNYLYLLSNKEFLRSQYFKAWSEFLNDKETDLILENNHYDLVFYPHFELQKFIGLFQCASKNIIIADKEHYDVQSLLKESKLLITDFSSVFFDFAYMGKTYIQYEFDKHDYYERHYPMGYFVDETMGFGEIVYNHQSLMEQFRKYIENGCQMKEIHKDRATEFFELCDTNNSDRIYAEIEKLQ